MKYRGRASIVASMLESAREAASTNAIMRRAGMSYDQVREYLPVLQDIGFMQASGGAYVTTEKGAGFLRLYGEMAALTQKKIDI